MAAPSNFDFLQPRWRGFHAEARRVERDTLFDPLSTCFFARRTLEVAVGWMYRADKSLTLPYKDDLNARLFEPTFKTVVGPTIHVKMDLIRRLGNRAAHQGGKPLTDADALGATRDLFHIMFWLATTYAPSPNDRPDPGIAFNPALLSQPGASPVVEQTSRPIAEDPDRARGQGRRAHRRREAHRVSGRPDQGAAGRSGCREGGQRREGRHPQLRRRRPATASSICCCANPAGR